MAQAARLQRLENCCVRFVYGVKNYRYPYFNSLVHFLQHAPIPCTFPILVEPDYTTVFFFPGLREMFPDHLDLEVYCDVALC